MDEFLKDKPRAKRLALTNTAIDRQVAINKQHKGTNVARGNFKKRHAMDCGKPKCTLCGNRRNRALKLKDRLTVQELSALETPKLEQGFAAESANDSFDECLAA